MKRLRIFLASVGEVNRGRNPGTTPPMGLLCLAAYLRTKFDLEIQIVDQRVEGWRDEHVVRSAINFEPDIVGLGAMTPLAHSQRTIAQHIRESLPKALIVLGGPHTSALDQAALEETVADAAVLGEGERSLELIVEAYLGDTDLRHVPGLIWRTRDGEVIRNPGAVQPIEDLDTLPFPAYDLINLRKYWRQWSISVLPRRRYISITTSRGCPFQCYWCHDIFGKRFRANSAQRIVEEIEHYIRAFGVNDIEFLDDVFNMDRRRVFEFSDLVRKRNIKVGLSFSNGLRADLLTEGVLDSLSAAGAYYTALALETGSPRLQLLSGKRLNIEAYMRSVAMCAKRHIFTNGFHILGLPTETEAEIEKTINLACESNLHTGMFSTPMPFPKTALHKLVMKTHPERLANVDFRGFDYYTSFVNISEFPDKVLFRYQRDANRRFYANLPRLRRILRDMPRPYLLPLYLPVLVGRANRSVSVGNPPA